MPKNVEPRTAFPDGEYRLRVTASDAPGNPLSEALTARIESDASWIDNTQPKIIGLAEFTNVCNHQTLNSPARTGLSLRAS